MRTTLHIDDQLLKAAKKAAVDSGNTLTALVEDAIRQALAQGKQSSKASRFKLPTLNLGEARPGIDLDNSAALLDIMESDHGAV